MGFKEIYIIGVDLSYVVPDSAIKGAVLESTEDDINHFEKILVKEKLAYTNPGEC